MKVVLQGKNPYIPMHFFPEMSNIYGPILLSFSPDVNPDQFF